MTYDQDVLQVDAAAFAAERRRIAIVDAARALRHAIATLTDWDLSQNRHLLVVEGYARQLTDFFLEEA